MIHSGIRRTQRFVWSSLVWTIFILSLLILLTACPGVDIEDPTPPSKPEWVQKSLPDDWPERGIDAHESGGIYLEWQARNDEDIIAYTIYKAIFYEAKDSLGDYSRLIRLETNSYPDPEYIDGRVFADTIYYYKIKAEDATGSSSEFSDAANYQLLMQIQSKFMTPSGLSTPLGQGRQLSWITLAKIDLEDYYITLLSQENELLSRVWKQPESYTGDPESWQIPEDIILEAGSSYKWKIDAAAKYIDDRETKGSESPWAYFLYTGN